MPGSTRPYLIRALYEWCADNGLTPFIAVAVDGTVSVPMEYVRDGEIVLNISMDATSGLLIGNDAIEFKGRFGGVARDLYVPIHRVLAIYARENGQGMAFPLQPAEGGVTAPAQPEAAGSVVKAAVVKEVKSSDAATEPPPRPPSGGARPTLTRIK
ncbi:ClpXP protease specificity-enhancing factor [Curvibacter sp. APW13]|uniref:ClpXP protease specificity-enhancing factor n=1 Tax=Curvibacter sp. APW13 TaxID=3077236 RepID=UPI0028DD46F0|nr:ClpXP protease specificity-enhancing factor [Curvibacter sp. APW13]MDT8989541.1 ClpXP protease specificity-enhancing factor [Curvibacter sp. APW13]